VATSSSEQKSFQGKQQPWRVVMETSTF